MIGGVSGVEGDVIPFGSVIGNRARLAGLNVVGLKRRGFEKAQIRALRSAFRAMFHESGVFAVRLAEARLRHGADPLVAEVLAFIDAPSHRGLIRAGRAPAATQEAA
jgi:UDP-N-acetylglucosamine acyltransferase